MGQTFIEAINNSYSTTTTFAGTILVQNCMNYVNNLLTVSPGLNNVGVIAINTGSYFAVGYALPGVPQGSYNFAIGLGAYGSTVTLPPPWLVQSIQNGLSTAYVWTLAEGVNVQLDSFPSGTISQTIASASATDEAQRSAPLGKMTITVSENTLTGAENDPARTMPGSPRRDP